MEEAKETLSSDSKPAQQALVLPPQAYSYLYPEEAELNLLDYWRVLIKRKWLIIVGCLIALLLSIVATFLMPKKYTNKATLISVQQASMGGLGALAAQVGSLPMIGSHLGGLADLGSDKSQDLVNILESNTLIEKVIKQLDLMPVLFESQWNPKSLSFEASFLGFVPELEDGIKKFNNKVAVVEIDQKSNLINIEVTLKDSVLASKVVNAMVLSLQDFINKNSLTVAKRNRAFIEEQLVKNRAKVLEAGKKLNQFYGGHNISSVKPQLDVAVGSYEPLAKTFEEFRRNLEGLQAQQSQIEKKKIQAKVKNVPSQVYLEYLTVDYEILNKANALLTQQYELAKIEETKEDLAFQILDQAKPSIRPSSPKLILNMLIALVCSFFIFVFLAFFLEYLQKLKAKESV